MEIITGVERRRHWRDEEKLRILAELDQPGIKFSEVARRHDVSRGLLWQWRDAQRRGRLAAETPVFLPLQVVPNLIAALQEHMRVFSESTGASWDKGPVH